MSSTVAPKIVLYWLEQSKAHRILWLLEEIGLKYDLKIYKRENGLAPEELKKINGLGKAPIISVEDPSLSPEPIILSESALITEFLVSNYAPQLAPPPSDLKANLRYKFYLYYAEGGVFQPLLVHHILDMVHTASPFFIKPVVGGLLSQLKSRWLNKAYDDHLGYVERELEGKKFLLGEHFSGVDCLHSFNWQSLEKLGALNSQRYPRLMEYWNGLQQREAYKKAQEKVKGHKALL
ncbi:glutathione S-transferase [Gloeophyllum trabeum ATCC 11539]|uniref:Glutathione S-transferase n=1 Tax=Gloeophyllum trabeum (strain ATCC 11539 / FP-39264 / Madison 617) TaxID=670483 RepID=S7Q4J8_GLOTA|nr:glutathione S-transferase [Gloeophyllum trabeum ATCC 11539]EPQ54427.1 glutathione S-transferase [Gloeophyllum trabeum ATCC 11539]